jgi:hypothetical protein
MKLSFSLATPAEVPALVALHAALARDLTSRYGHGFWSSEATERGTQFGVGAGKTQANIL